MDCTRSHIPSDTVTSRRSPVPEGIPNKIKQLYQKNGIGDWIGLNSSDQVPICYLSGTIGSKGFTEEEFLNVTGCKFRCFSFAYCGFGSPLMQGRHATALDYCLQNGVRVFMDSGAHSFHKLKHYSTAHGKGLSAIAKTYGNYEQFLAQFMKNYTQYVKWCYSTNRKFDFHVTFDSEKDCPTIFKMTDALFKLGIFPVPVYHGDQSFNWVRRYADLGHKFIGVGRHSIGKHSVDNIRRYYDNVITECTKLGIYCHGFAATGDRMFEFPFWSVDSTSWLKCAAYGKLMDYSQHRDRVTLIHVSHKYAESTKVGTLDAFHPSVKKYVRDIVESVGFDFDKVRDDLTTRALYNAKVTVDAVNKHTRIHKGDWSKVF